MADVLYLIRDVMPSSGAGTVPALSGLMWEPPVRVFSSPLPCAVRTAERLAAESAVTMETDAELTERDGGETEADYRRRVEETWRRFMDIPDKAVACVSHGGILTSWCCLFLGIEVERCGVFEVERGAVTAFVRKRDGSGWELAYLNNRESGHDDESG